MVFVSANIYNPEYGSLSLAIPQSSSIYLWIDPNCQV